jgi:hypothetical protein
MGRQGQWLARLEAAGLGEYTAAIVKVNENKTNKTSTHTPSVWRTVRFQVIEPRQAG